MENATNAMLIAAGVLIGILILSLAVFLFADFSNSSRQIAETVQANQLIQFNSQFTIYENRDDILIHDIISLHNLAKNNNQKYEGYTNFETEYKITISIQGEKELDKMTSEEYNKLISTFSNVHQTGDSGISEDDIGEIKTYFTSSNVEYHSSGRVKSMVFQEIK